MTPVIMPYYDSQAAQNITSYSISYKHIANLKGYTTSHAYSKKKVRSPSTRVVANLIMVVKKVTWQMLYPRQNKKHDISLLLV